MEIKEITYKEEWDNKIGTQKMAQFLQSWEWGEFQQRLNRKIWRLDFDGVYILVIKMTLPFNKSYLYIPRLNFELNKNIIEGIKDLAKKEGCIFIKIESIKQNLGSLGFKKVKNTQPNKTLLLDLTKSEEQLLDEMHQKWRYNIRLAAKKGVTLQICREEEFLKFYDLLVDTFRRKEKKLFNCTYYNKLYQDHLAKIYFAQYESKILCANMIVFFGDTATYLYGGSAPDDKNLMAPHFLQWELIKIAKNKGYKYYDFWGIDEAKWPGVTRFKKGFGGFEIEYAGSWDLPVDKAWFLLYKIVKIFR
ncbi:peptidoglycan bridge formation glycyltransferase FemA/FemB family protein [Candidatus Falkowbacteria bacterium]|nr:peptidoglycan bridge formation glycyltransferase FemA/FemB family protein [Candidatus Falkowbacteria bacterium]